MSPAAVGEWAAFQSLWPTDDELRAGTVSVSDDALEVYEGKVRRFVDILSAPSAAAARAPEPYCAASA